MASLATGRDPRYRSLDAWRGAACLMVVAYHAADYAWHPSMEAARRAAPAGTAVASALACGWLGVPMFFVISGYCIAATSDASRRRARAPADFFRRRLRRIYPPYWAALALTAALSLALARMGWPGLLDDDFHPIPGPGSLTPAQWAGNVALAENWRANALGGDPRNLLLGPAWTLCYEEQFYAICGALLALWPRRFFAGVAAFSLLTLLPLAARRVVVGLWLDGDWFLFLAGVAVYYHAVHAGRAARRAIVAGLAATAAACLATRGVGSWHARVFAFGPAYALLLIALRPLDGRLMRSRAGAALAAPGRMCYSLYLVHWPVAKLVAHALYLAGVRTVWGTLLVSAPLATAAALLAARPFHRWVERPWLNPPRAGA